MRFALALVLCTAAPAARAAEDLAVQIVTATPATRSQSYSLTGELRASDSISAAFPVAGRVTEVLAQEGDDVGAGMVLARLDDVQQVQAQRAAQAGVATAEADVAQAQADFTRYEQLFSRSAVTRARRDEAEDALRAAEASLAQASAELERADKALRDTTLRAPQDATVTDRLAENGQVVSAAQPVFELALDTGMEAVFDVPEVLLTTGKPPPDVTLWQLSKPDILFEGVVDEVSPLVDPDTGTVAVTLRLPDPPEGLGYGEAVRGRVEHPETDALIELPWTALTTTAGGSAVWTVGSDDTVTLTPVTVARYETEVLLLSDGIAPGTRVVGHGAQLLFPGRRVVDVESLQ